MAKGEIDLTRFTAEAKNEKPEPAVEKVKALASGTPKLKQEKVKEREKQFNIGLLPVSVHQAIDDSAHDARMNRKSFILKALSDAGVEIPAEYIKDRRRTD